MKSHDILQKVSITYLLLINKALYLLIRLIGLTKGHPRLFWKEHEHEYPVLARLARDILSIPASGAGVERLFNCARDICHYRRGQLKPETIRCLMLHLFASKFELQQSELERIKEYLSGGEAAILDQTWKPTPSLNDMEPISDNEEEGYQSEDVSDDSENDFGDNHTVQQATPIPVITQGKQPRCKSLHVRTDAVPRTAVAPPAKPAA